MANEWNSAIFAIVKALVFFTLKSLWKSSSKIGIKAEATNIGTFSFEGPSIKALKASKLAFLCVRLSELIKSSKITGFDQFKR